MKNELLDYEDEIKLDEMMGQLQAIWDEELIQECEYWVDFFEKQDKDKNE